MMQDVRAALASEHGPDAFTGSVWQQASAAAASHAPYLRRLIMRRPDLLLAPDEAWADRILREAIAAADAIAAAPPPIEEAMVLLRRAKDAAHLAAALADLSRVWPLMQVTGALTQFADAALRAAVSVAAAESAKRGDLVAGAFDSDVSAAPGVSLIAMGKMGAGELNYSSDIDFSVFFDGERLLTANARKSWPTRARVSRAWLRCVWLRRWCARSKR
jgi:[glutamine synthetase] adenylyltransferase / [glutamine synthetase]-adenylyl-L-tyrosine phosphorylase